MDRLCDASVQTTPVIVIPDESQQGVIEVPEDSQEELQQEAVEVISSQEEPGEQPGGAAGDLTLPVVEEEDRPLQAFEINFYTQESVAGAAVCGECVICQVALAPGDVMRTLGCFHVFHDRCLEPWLLQRSSCPQCTANVVGLALTAGRYTDGLVHVRI